MASTYSFDVVSDFDRQELVNTLDQVRRDVGNRYDLKDSNTEIDLEETELVITTASDMTLQAVEDVLRTKATKRNLSLKIFDSSRSGERRWKPGQAGGEASQGTQPGDRKRS